VPAFFLPKLVFFNETGRIGFGLDFWPAALFLRRNELRAYLRNNSLERSAF